MVQRRNIGDLSVLTRGTLDNLASDATDYAHDDPLGWLDGDVVNHTQFDTAVDEYEVVEHSQPDTDIAPDGNSIGLSVGEGEKRSHSGTTCSR